MGYALANERWTKKALSKPKVVSSVDEKAYVASEETHSESKCIWVDERYRGDQKHLECSGWWPAEGARFPFYFIWRHKLLRGQIESSTWSPTKWPKLSSKANWTWRKGEPTLHTFRKVTWIDIPLLVSSYKRRWLLALKLTKFQWWHSICFTAGHND